MRMWGSTANCPGVPGWTATVMAMDSVTFRIRGARVTRVGRGMTALRPTVRALRRVQDMENAAMKSQDGVTVIRNGQVKPVKFPVCTAPTMATPQAACVIPVTLALGAILSVRETASA